jgi:UDP-N-acetylmuramoyl-tripeptide--D-alanyl-D-alanine ligase
MSRATVIAVTGAVGKTSLQDMLREVLSRQIQVYAPRRGESVVDIPNGVQVAIFDCGAVLPEGLVPDIAVSTTGDDLLAAGIQIAPHGGTVSFGAHDAADWRLIEVGVSADATVCRAAHKEMQVLFKLNAPGRHFAHNALAALAVVNALGADLGRAAVDLGHWRPAEGRGRMRHVMLDVVNEALRIDLIDDTANATPACVEAALDVLAQSAPPDARGRRVAILGDMAGSSRHGQLAGLSALGEIDLIHCAGAQMRGFYDKIPQDQRGLWAETASGICTRPSRLSHAGDVVLVKGAQAMNMAQVVDAIANLGQSVDDLFEGPR